MNDEIKLRVWFILILAICVCVLILLEAMIIPAYYSVKANCEENPDLGEYEVAGTFSILENNTAQITIMKNDTQKESDKYLKHELCHYTQYQEARLFTCTDKQLLYLNELECYFKQNLPLL